MDTLFSTTPAPALAPSRPAPAPTTHAALERNVLAQDVRITGCVRFVGILIIDGQLDGEIDSEGTLLVGEHARLQGEITVGEAIIHGRVEGTLRISGRCELHASACLVGELTAGRLVLHEGASFLGTSKVVGGGERADPAVTPKLTPALVVPSAASSKAEARLPAVVEAGIAKQRRAQTKCGSPTPRTAVILGAWRTTRLHKSPGAIHRPER